MDNKKMYMIYSSHLDREWYFSYEETRIYACSVLDEVMDLLKEIPEYKFMLDGQTSVLGDYIEIYPQREQELAKYIAEGRFVVGPWYIQPDEYIPAGESIVRNLLLGDEIAGKYGKSMKVGYVPDSFGHVSQLPQILKSFNIDTVFMSRGLPTGTPRDFCWEGIDGTVVVGMTQGYGSGNELDPGNMKEGIRMIEDPEKIQGLINSLINDAEKADLAPFGMMIYGGDMMGPAKNFRNLGFPSYDNLEDCMEMSKKFKDKYPLVKGELRNSPDILYSLQDTVVSRVYLKTENHRAQNSLINYAEPLCFLAYGTGKMYPANFLKKSWQYLLDNHTHDGICGCSNDDVHSEMMTRFRKSENISERWADIALQKLADDIDTSFGTESEIKNMIVVFNPKAYDIKGTVEVEFSLIWNEAPEHFRIQDGNGVNIPYQIISKEEREFIRSDFESVQHFTGEYVYKIALQQDVLPAFGIKVFEIVPTEEEIVIPKSASMENEFVTVSFNENGTFDINDKKTGKIFTGLNYYIDEGDGGDSYKYVHIDGKVFDSRNLKWEKEFLSEGPLCSVCHMYTTWDLPAEMTGKGEGRSENTVTNSLEYYATLYADSPVVHIKTVIDNKSKDHRIRAWMPTGIDRDYVWADSIFSLEKRQDIMLRGTQPMQGVCAINDSTQGLAIFSKGLHQYEYLPEENGSMALSLLRCQGALYRWIFQKYNKEYSQCQCIGKYEMEYAICPYEPVESGRGDIVPDDILKYGWLFSSGLKSAQTGVHKGSIPWEKSFISVDTPYVYMSSVKMTGDSKRIAVRFCNYSDREELVKISHKIPAKEIVKMTLSEEVEAVLFDKDGVLEIQVKPFEIFTIGFGDVSEE